MESKAKRKTIRRVVLGFIRVEENETLEEAIGYYAGPDGTLRLDSLEEVESDIVINNGGRAYKITAEAV